MPRKPETEVSTCPVCGELGQVYAYGEQVLSTGEHGVGWVLSQGVCRECLTVVVEAAREGSLPALEEGA
jgi:hypothetical protein